MAELHFQKTVFYGRYNLRRTDRKGWQPQEISIHCTYEEGNAPTREQMHELAMTTMSNAESACASLNTRPDDYDKFIDNGANQT